MCQLNIEVATTVGESPFSNGTVERHNKVLAEAMQKTLDDVKCELEIALAWALSAKNALQNCGMLTIITYLTAFKCHIWSCLACSPQKLT